MAAGMANKQIADDLGISSNTVKFHTSSIYQKLGRHQQGGGCRPGHPQGATSTCKACSAVLNGKMHAAV